MQQFPQEQKFGKAAIIEEDLLEHRTDETDAFDTLYIGYEKFPQHGFYPIPVGGIR